jgi:hypothetical protein
VITHQVSIVNKSENTLLTSTLDNLLPFQIYKSPILTSIGWCAELVKSSTLVGVTEELLKSLIATLYKTLLVAKYK